MGGSQKWVHVMLVIHEPSQSSCNIGCCTCFFVLLDQQRFQSSLKKFGFLPVQSSNTSTFNSFVVPCQRISIKRVQQHSILAMAGWIFAFTQDVVVKYTYKVTMYHACQIFQCLIKWQVVSLTIYVAGKQNTLEQI